MGDDYNAYEDNDGYSSHEDSDETWRLGELGSFDEDFDLDYDEDSTRLPMNPKEEARPVPAREKALEEYFERRRTKKNWITWTTSPKSSIFATSLKREATQTFLKEEHDPPCCDNG